MKTKNKNSALSNQRGFSLPELLVVMALMAVVAVAIAEVTMRTVSAMLMATSQNMAQSSVEQIVTKIAEDVRSAGRTDKKAIRSGSNGTSLIFTRFGQNLDAFAPGNSDMNFDEACYQFIQPNGTDPFSTAYRSGYISGGVGSGGQSPACPNMYRLTDQFSDVRDLKFQYCRPTGSAGSYNCSTVAIANEPGLDDYNDGTPAGGDLVNTAACVWMVKISVKYSRKYNKNGPQINPTYYQNAVSTYETSVTPRNIEKMANFMNNKENGDSDIQDCCDPFFAYSADWCKPPASN
jgi:prepilin-type N-terminal cleavage/methylation domain-containing protein